LLVESMMKVLLIKEREEEWCLGKKCLGSFDSKGTSKNLK
jgi:hypothetical protein